MPFVELKEYTLEPEGFGEGLLNIDFSLSAGEVYDVQADQIDDATLFLKGLATLACPVKGTYRFDGEYLNLTDYRQLLSCKRRIGYISQHAAMISNQTVRENLLLIRYFHENSLGITLDDDTESLCRQFDLIDKLDQKPGGLHPQDIQNAITVRELSKAADLLLLERPEDFIDNTKIDILIKVLKKLQDKGLTIVFFSFDDVFERAFAVKNILISNGNLNLFSP